MAFAAPLSRQYSSIVNCPHLGRPIEEKATYPVYDRQGKVVKTVSINIDSGCLQQKVSLNEARIQDLQSCLVSFEKDKGVNFDTANS